MSIRPDLFGTAPEISINRDASTSGTGVAGEIDLRAEFDCLIYGPNGDGVGRHGHPLVLRKARRDADGYPTYCTCAAENSGRHADPSCSFCDGEGFLWDESWTIGYSMFVGPDGGQARKFLRLPPGNIRVDYKVFFFRYDSDIRYGDKVVEMRLDEEGALITPYTREAIYKPQTIAKMRSDNGRIEYYAVYCREEDALRHDNPVNTGTVGTVTS